MAGDPFLRFLGVPSTSDDRELLGLPDGPQSALTIEVALRRKLEAIYRHPARQTPEAEFVRRRLREAAARLTSPQAPSSPQALRTPTAPSAPQPPRATPPPMISQPPRTGSAPVATRAPNEAPAHVPSPPAQGVTPAKSEPARAVPSSGSTPPGPARAALGENVSSGLMPLTPFDRTVLATLVGAGGWNRQSRSRLVAAAQAHGVSPAGLLAVLRALDAHARAGHAITAELARSAPSPEAAGSGSEERADPVTKMMERLAPELTVARDSIWSTLKLAVVAVALVVFAVVFVLRASRPERVDSPSVAERTDSPAIDSAREPSTGVNDSSAGPVMARFVRAPGLKGRAQPADAGARVDEAIQRGIDLVDLRDRFRAGERSEVFMLTWRGAIDATSRAWMLLQPTDLDRIEAMVREVLVDVAAEPAVAESFARELAPRASAMDDPLALWERAWRAGTIAQLKGHPLLAPSAASRLARELSASIPSTPVSMLPSDFRGGALAMLEEDRKSLVALIDSDSSLADRWETFLAVLRRVAGPGEFQESVTRTIGAVLSSKADFTTAGPHQDVLARLLDAVDFGGHPVPRAALHDWFDDEQNIPSANLWVLCSLLAQGDHAPWFDASLVIGPEEAGSARRRRRDRIDTRWPTAAETALVTAASVPAAVNAESVRVWSELTDRVLAVRLPDDDDGALTRIVLLTRMAALASLLIEGESAEFDARRVVLDEVLAALENRQPPALLFARGGAREVGSAEGADALLTAALEEAGNTLEKRLTALRALRSRRGSDLGPIDAATLAAEALRGSSRQTRDLAQSIIIDQFARGANVSSELLDQFFDGSRRTAEMTEFIEVLTGSLLPSPSSESWTTEARLALLKHAMALDDSAAVGGESIIAELSEAFAERVTDLDPTLGSGASLEAPEIVAQLVDQFVRRAAGVRASPAVPAELPVLAQRRAVRRRIAADTAQRLVAEQITLLEHVAYTLAAQVPALAPDIGRVLRGSLAARRASRTVLEQSVEAARAETAIWALRLADRRNSA